MKECDKEPCSLNISILERFYQTASPEFRTQKQTNEIIRYRNNCCSRVDCPMLRGVKPKERSEVEDQLDDLLLGS